MRFTSSIVRKLMKGGSLVLLSLLIPTLATAASAPHRGGAQVCDPSTVPLRKLARLPKTIGGPLAGPSTRAAAGLSDAVAKVHRGSRTALADDDEAIQNDAPAAWHDADEDLAPGLEPLGSLARACVHKPTTHDFSPRSPRGPPLAG
jgi:hypothetical protein